jgi:hypothetical protein
VLLAIAGVSIVGCAARQLAPEALPLDRVQCAHCRMIVSSAIGAGQIVSARNETRFYDDIGCLAADWTAHSADAIAFVRVDEAWIDVKRAAFARLDGVRTAMNSGVVAYATPDAVAAHGGRGLTWDDVVRGANDGAATARAPGSP